MRSAVAAYCYKQDSEPIDAERAIALWRKVLAQLITDYFENYKDADKEVMSTCLDNLCEIVGFDTESTRKAIIQAKQEFQTSRQGFHAWLEKRYTTTVRCRVVERRRHTKNNVGGLFKLLDQKRLERVCPDIAERIQHDKQNKSGVAARRTRVFQGEEEQERRRVQEFYKEFWGRSGHDQSNKSQGGE